MGIQTDCWVFDIDLHVMKLQKYSKTHMILIVLHIYELQLRTVLFVQPKLCLFPLNIQFGLFWIWHEVGFALVNMGWLMFFCCKKLFLFVLSQFFAIRFLNYRITQWIIRTVGFDAIMGLTRQQMGVVTLGKIIPKAVLWSTLWKFWNFIPWGVRRNTVIWYLHIEDYFWLKWDF